MSICRWCGFGPHLCKCEESKKYQGPSVFKDPDEEDKETYDRARGYGKDGIQSYKLQRGWYKRLEPRRDT